jgi:hypothetical protein
MKIKHYQIPLPVRKMEKLKKVVGVKTAKEAMEIAIEYTIKNFPTGE